MTGDHPEKYHLDVVLCFVYTIFYCYVGANYNKSKEEIKIILYHLDL